MHRTINLKENSALSRTLHVLRWHKKAARNKKYFKYFYFFLTIDSGCRYYI